MPKYSILIKIYSFGIPFAINMMNNIQDARKLYIIQGGAKVITRFPKAIILIVNEKKIVSACK